MSLQITYNMYKEHLALNNLQGLIWRKTQLNQTKTKQKLPRIRKYL